MGTGSRPGGFLPHQFIETERCYIVAQFHLCVRPFTLHSLLPQGPVKRHPFKNDVQIRPLDGKDEQRSTVVIEKLQHLDFVSNGANNQQKQPRCFSP